MEDSAVDTVVWGTLITSGASAFITGLYGIVQRNPHFGLIAGAAAVNSGVTAVTFFGIREFAISPLLTRTLPWPQYTRRKLELGLIPASDSHLVPPTWSDLRKHKTLDSGLSGALAGGALRGWKAGRRAIFPGALMIGGICTLLQLAYNETTVRRLKYISTIRGDATVSAPQTSSHPSRSISGRLLGLIGVRQVTNEEYIERMKKTRDAHLERIAELEAQIASEEASQKKSS